jgi:SAM-dependent methyltransferase
VTICPPDAPPRSSTRSPSAPSRTGVPACPVDFLHGLPRLLVSARLATGCCTNHPAAILAFTQPDQAVINRWSGAAPFWEKHRELIRQMFAPVTQALAEDGRIGSRHTVLDIATGPGEPALTLADLVGPEGKVIGIDPVPEMVAAARRASDHPGFRNIQFDVASADHLPFAADTFDAAARRRH